MIELVILRGVRGSHKGVVARALLRTRGELEERWMNIDVHTEKAEGKEARTAARKAAYMLAEHKAMQALRDGISVVLTGVFAQGDDVRRVLETARAAGARKTRVVYCPPVGDTDGHTRHLLRLFEHMRMEETYHEGIFDL